MRVQQFSLPLLLTLSLLWRVVAAEIVVRDGLGNEVTLPAAAQRIVTLAPHTTELLFAGGGGARIIATVEYSNYPSPAKEIPRIGGYHQPDLEKILALKPDLVIAWSGGNPKREVELLQELGLVVFVSAPQGVEDIFSEIVTLARLTATEEVAEGAVAALKRRWQALERRAADRPPVTLFYQLWDEPLMTINGDHIIDQIIRRCGGENIFAAIPTLIPKIGVEAVIAANPEVIVASGMGEARPDWLQQWQQWPELRAVKRQQLFFIPPDLIQRHSPRILDGAELLCDYIGQADSSR
ncbi:MAG: cobalamin-binding protein [Gammaproteobacteria bacterium]|nr:cobalamin-binding protein [Gammaproteobacteria bacterium]